MSKTVKYLIIIILLLMLIIASYWLGLNSIKTFAPTASDFKDSVTTQFTQTFYVVSDLNKTDNSGNFNYYVLEQFQKDNPAVVKINKTYKLENGKNYEITFKGLKSESAKEYSIFEIFNNFEMVSINLTNKVGLEQIQEGV